MADDKFNVNTLGALIEQALQRLSELSASAIQSAEDHASLSYLQERFTELRTQVGSLQENLRSLSTVMSSVDPSKPTFSTKFTAIEHEINQINWYLKNFEKDLEIQKSIAKDLTADIALIKQMLSTALTEIKSLKEVSGQVAAMSITLDKQVAYTDEQKALQKKRDEEKSQVKLSSIGQMIALAGLILEKIISYFFK